MKRLIVICTVVAAITSAMSEASQAQFGSSQSNSWSNSYSENWGSSQGFGPNGYYNNNFRDRQSEGSFAQNNTVNTPWGGRSTGSTQNWGNRQRQFDNSGWSPSGGTYNNRGGSFDSFNNGRTYNNTWPW